MPLIRTEKAVAVRAIAVLLANARARWSRAKSAR
jgi:hypothetical protein